MSTQDSNHKLNETIRHQLFSSADRDSSPSPTNTSRQDLNKNISNFTNDDHKSTNNAHLPAPKPTRNRPLTTNLFNSAGSLTKNFIHNTLKSSDKKNKSTKSKDINNTHELNSSNTKILHNALLFNLDRKGKNKNLSSLNSFDSIESLNNKYPFPVKFNETSNVSSRSISPLNTDDHQSITSIEKQLRMSPSINNDISTLSTMKDNSIITTSTNDLKTKKRAPIDNNSENPFIAQSKALVLELDLDCNIKFISRSWEVIVGTKIAKIINNPIRNIIVGNESDKDVFHKATSIMTLDDESYKIRFIVQTNLKTTDNNSKSSIQKDSPTLSSVSSEKTNEDDYVQTNFNKVPSNIMSKTSNDNSDNDSLSIHSTSSTITTDGGFLELEAQGILIHDKFNKPSHSMWIVKPWVPIQNVDLKFPDELISTLGTFGINLMESYITYLTELETTDENDLPPPSMELCRICEEKVPNWWLEKHSELCLVEHRVEDLVYINQEELQEHRKLLQNILESLQKKLPQSQSQASTSSTSTSSSVLSPLNSPQSFGLQNSSSETSLSSSSSSSNSSFVSINEYKGFPIPLGPHNLNTPQSLIQRRKSSGTLLPQIRFPFRNLEILLSYCDEALLINPGEIRSTYKDSAEFVEIAYSPNSRIALKNLHELNLPASSDPAIQQLTEDTKLLVDNKLETIERYSHILQYVDRITRETNELVLLTVKNAVQKIREHVFCFSESESETDIASINKNKSFTSLQIGYPKTLKSSNQGVVFNNAYLESSFTGSKEDLRMTSSSYNLSSGNSTPRTSTPGLIRRSTPIITVASDDAPRLKGNITGNSLLTPQRPTSPSYSLPLSSLQKNPKKGDSTFSSPFNSPYLQPVESTKMSLGSLMLQQSSTGDKPPLSPLLVSTTPKHQAPSIKDYEIIKPISKGAFGSVFLAKRKLTGDYVAIKVLKKSDMIAKNQVTNVKAERAIMMAQCDSDHVVQLIASFQSTHYLYLVMEYLNGGDLATLLHNMGTLPDVWARQYIAEVIVDVDDLHSKGIVHRDLKPDNLLIDHWGHVKLTDFGLSRMGLVNRQRTIEKYTDSKLHSRSLSQGNGLASTHGSLSSNKSISGLGAPGMGSIGGTPTSSQAGSFSGQPFRAGSFSTTNNNDEPFKNVPPANAITSKLLPVEPFSLNSPETPIKDGNFKSYFTSSPSELKNEPAPFSMLGLPQNVQQEYKTRARTLSSASRLSINSISSELQNSLNPSSNVSLLSPINNKNLQSTSQNSKSQNFLTKIDPDSSTQSIEVPKTYALFDPSESKPTRMFVGTPDYLAPETVSGKGQDKSSDWWSIGCIFFEFLFGYPPFNDATPEKVFNNILYGEIQWPEVSQEVFDELCSPNAKDLIEKLLIKDPTKRLGSGGSKEIMEHRYFEGIKWDTLFDEDASFVPEVEDPESTDYFDARGATMNSFPVDDDNLNSPDDYAKPANEKDNGYTGDLEMEAGEDDFIKDDDIAVGDEDEEVLENEEEDEEEEEAIFCPTTNYMNDNRYKMRRDVTSNSNSSSSFTIESPRQSFSKTHALASPRERRSSRLNDAGSSSEFGSFQFRNLMVLEKQNKDAINRLKSEHLEHRNSISSIASSEGGYVPQSTGSSSSGYGVGSAPATPLTGVSRGRAPQMPTSHKRSSSPNSQLITGNLKSPILSFIPSPVNKFASLNLETSNSGNTNTNNNKSNTGQLSNKNSVSSSSTTNNKLNKKDSLSSPALHILTKSFTRTLSDFSPSSSDNEERNSIISKIRKSNASRNRVSSSSSTKVPHNFRNMKSTLPTLTVLLFEPIPIHRYSITNDLKQLGCIVFSCASGSELIKLSSGNIIFDIIFTSTESQRLNSLDLVKLIRNTSSLNTNATMVALTSYYKDSQNTGIYDYMIEYPITKKKLQEVINSVEQNGINTEEAIVSDTE